MWHRHQYSYREESCWLAHTTSLRIIKRECSPRVQVRPVRWAESSISQTAYKRSAVCHQTTRTDMQDGRASIYACVVTRGRAVVSSVSCVVLWLDLVRRLYRGRCEKLCAVMKIGLHSLIPWNYANYHNEPSPCAPCPPTAACTCSHARQLHDASCTLTSPWRIGMSRLSETSR